MTVQELPDLDADLADLLAPEGAPSDQDVQTIADHCAGMTVWRDRCARARPFVLGQDRWSA